MKTANTLLTTLQEAISVHANDEGILSGAEVGSDRKAKKETWLMFPIVLSLPLGFPFS